MSASMGFRERLGAYVQLVRLDKPVGIELLLWATLWGVLLSSFGYGQAQGLAGTLPNMRVFVVFALGVVLMRSAGCAINDFADRKVDGHVNRTKGRPLADGRLRGRDAVWTFLILSWISASLLFFLPVQVFYWSLIAVALAFIYPFMKRFTHLPQVFLAAAFGWAIPMAYVAVQGTPDVWCWLLFLGYMCWTVAYDTQYAMADREEDLRIGVKSTAILFGRYDLLVIGILQGLFLLLLGVVFWHYFVPTPVGWLPVLGLGVVVLMFVWQYRHCASRKAGRCFEAFLANVWIGRYVFGLLAVCCAWVVFMG